MRYLVVLIHSGIDFAVAIRYFYWRSKKINSLRTYIGVFAFAIALLP